VRARTRRSWAWRYRRLLFLVGLLTVTAVAGAAYLLVRLPLPPERVTAETTFLSDATGKPLARLVGTENRVKVPLASVPKVVVEAVVATEDHDFFRHGGVDPLGILRATLVDLRRGSSVEGGSTITQQYVKNAYVGRQRTLWRKIREAALSVKVERKLSKRQILERYLNTIYFGRGAYGVQSAARAYFGRDVSELGLPEAAYLAGLIRAPVTADAERDPRQAAARRARALAAMERARAITPAQRAEVDARPLMGPTGYVIPSRLEDPVVSLAEKGTQYFVDVVRSELIRRYGEATVDGGGLRVTTSMDLVAQAAAYDAVYGYLKEGEPSGALVALDDQGGVKAMVGGRDYARSKVNLALGQEGGGSGRQAGSTFKPFLLAETVKEGYTVESAFPAPVRITIPHADNGNPYTITNFEGESFQGSLNLIDATKDSVNTVYGQLQAIIGPPHLVDMAHALGVRSRLEPNASLVLGTSEVSALEMASAYSTFADRGDHVDPQPILEVRTADGRVLERARAAHTRVLQTRDADVVNFCLQQVVLRGTGTGAQIGRPLAGKTGTTSDYGDAWFIGYTPRLTAAVWVGYPEASTHKLTDVRGIRPGVNGGSIPAEIFRRFMSAAVRGIDTGGFAPMSRFPGRVLSADRLPFSLPTSTTAPSASSTTSTTTRPGATTTTGGAPGGSRPTSTTAAGPTTTGAKPGSSTSTTAR
jgi:penicillin-binding protein 1A